MREERRRPIGAVTGAAIFAAMRGERRGTEFISILFEPAFVHILLVEDHFNFFTINQNGKSVYRYRFHSVF
jgi:hypothetical protein